MKIKRIREEYVNGKLDTITLYNVRLGQHKSGRKKDKPAGPVKYITEHWEDGKLTGITVTSR